MRVFVKSCCRAIGMTLALVWVPRISEAADHQVWLKLSIDVPIFAPWDDGRIVFDAEQEEKFGNSSATATTGKSSQRSIT